MLTLEFSEDSEVQINKTSEGYVVESPFDKSLFETLEELYEGLTILDCAGILIPSSLFHELEMKLEQKNARGKLEIYPIDFTEGDNEYEIYS